MAWRQDQMERGSERMQKLCHLPIQLVLLGLESKLGCWSGTDFLWLSCAICMQSENSSGSCFRQSEQSSIKHPMLPGEQAIRQVWLAQCVSETRPLWRPGLGTEAPKGHQVSRMLWQGPELAAHAKAQQCLGSAKADWPKDTSLNTVMWNSWSGLRQSDFSLWEQPCLVMRLGWGQLLATHGFALQLPPGFIFGGDTAVTDRTCTQGCCSAELGGARKPLDYSASLSARTQRKSTVTMREELVLVSTPWHAHPVCVCACVGAPTRSPAIFLKKPACLQHGFWSCMAEKAPVYFHSPGAQPREVASDTECDHRVFSCPLTPILLFAWISCFIFIHVRGQVYPLTACSCSSGPISTSG